MMSCGAWRELLDEVALSAMDDGQLAALESHAAVCPDCFALLATERLLAGAWVGARHLRPSARLQSALLAVPRRNERLRAHSFWAVPVSMLAIGLLAWLAPDILKRQRAQIDMSADANSGAVSSASGTATTSSLGAASKSTASAVGPSRLATVPDASTAAAPATAPVAGRAALSAAATATPGLPAVGSVARERDPHRGGPPAATPTAADLGAGSASSEPGQPDPNPWPTSDPGGNDPSATPEPDPSPGGGVGLLPTETPPPEGPPNRRPDPSTPVATSTTEAPRVGMTPTPTEAPGGGSAQPVVPPTETPTPTPTVTPTVTTPGTAPTPAVTGP